jgi:hypothetical protein
MTRYNYSLQWQREAYNSFLRRQQREEEQRLREQETARLHQAALAESAAHAMHLESDVTGDSLGLRSLSKEMNGAEAQEEKVDESNQMVWHPVLRELVPLQSLNLEWESWRDH